jgi:hypothetical protein
MAAATPRPFRDHFAGVPLDDELLGRSQSAYQSGSVGCAGPPPGGGRGCPTEGAGTRPLRSAGRACKPGTRDYRPRTKEPKERSYPYVRSEHH